MYVFYSVLTSSFMDNLPKNTVFISLAHCIQFSALCRVVGTEESPAAPGAAGCWPSPNAFKAMVL